MVAAKKTENAAGETKQKTTDQKGELVNFVWWMKKNGYAETTIRVWTSALKTLKNFGADLSKPETVKEALTKATCQKINVGKPWSQSRKHVAIASYTLFLKMLGRDWNPPRCNVTRKLPFIPTEQEINSVISGCGRKMSTFLQLLKETGMRCGEANKLLWTDLDPQKRTLILNDTEKSGTPRVFNLSVELVHMLFSLPKKNSKIFGNVTMSSLKSGFFNSRRLLSKKLQNPRLLRISFHTFRHWKATTLYHETKDPLYVKEFLGHKKLDTTLLYIQLEKALYKTDSDQFNIKVAETKEEIAELLAVGFEYTCKKDGLLFFRKRK
ncbi:MAG: tyrosine-type recombinase/integrase [archaeon]